MEILLRTGMCQELVELAWEAKFKGEHARAMDLFRQAIDCDPMNAEAHRELALIYYGVKKDSLEAARLLQISLSLADSADAHYYLALVMERLGCKNEARSEFLSALRGYGGDVSSPVNAMILFHYGKFLAREGNFDEAEKHMKQALSIYPEYEPIKKGYTQLQEYMKKEDKPH